jgi:hypothetical protein
VAQVLDGRVVGHVVEHRSVVNNVPGNNTESITAPSVLLRA